MDWWWLSFVGDKGFLGGAWVGPAGCFHEARLLSIAQRINPGGELLAHGPSGPPPEKWQNRLLQKADIAQMNEEGKSDPDAIEMVRNIDPEAN